MVDLFDFNNPNLLLERHAALSLKRSSGTIEGSIKHGVVYTPVPDSTIHHTITAACPRPEKELESIGKYYMVGYISIPSSWQPRITEEVARIWDITFIGPVGVIQRLPPVLSDIENLIGDPLYVGFDYSWLGLDMKLQPKADSIKAKMTTFVTEMRNAL